MFDRFAHADYLLFSIDCDCLRQEVVSGVYLKKHQAFVFQHLIMSDRRNRREMF